jgi:hypothetical protein
MAGTVSFRTRVAVIVLHAASCPADRGDPGGMAGHATFIQSVRNASCDANEDAICCHFGAMRVLQHFAQ